MSHDLGDFHRYVRPMPAMRRNDAPYLHLVPSAAERVMRRRHRIDWLPVACAVLGVATVAAIGAALLRGMS